ncbi:MAG TPA: hypothetical protein PKW33_09695 [Anaerolineaceae bacterium]|nr:hypothetical protein [Anaerolineaceae bacterium]HPN51848.1 hypothetical protein [Anaerolineaceae bacterium]
MMGLLRLSLRCLIFVLTGVLLAASGQPAVSAQIQPGAEKTLRMEMEADPPFLIMDINTFPASSNSKNLLAVNGRLVFFSATTPAYGEELWVSDGTANGTKLVMDICPGMCSSSPARFIEKDGVLFFTATLPDTGAELWRSGGTSTNTIMVRDINPGEKSSSISSLVIFNDRLYFSAFDGVNGTELWESNGLEAGTTMTLDICPGSCSGAPKNLITFNNALYFRAYSASEGEELWKSDGTASGTAQFFSFNPGTGNSNVLDNRAVSDHYLFFTANSPASGNEVFRTDGTGTGTILLGDIVGGTGSSYPRNFAVLNNKLYFSATSGGDNELYVSDGLPPGTLLLKNINSLGSSYPQELTVANGKLYFTANNGSAGIEPWVSDGTATGTQLLKDIITGTESSNPTTFYNASGTLLFSAEDGVHGLEPWKSDGTVTSTLMLADNLTGSESGRFKTPAHFVDGDGHLNVLYVSRNAARGEEVWLYHRGGGGIFETFNVSLKDVNPSTQDSQKSPSPSATGKLGTQVVFVANDGVLGSEPWITDIYGSTPTLLKDINPDGGDGDPDEFTLFNGQLYFTAYNQGNKELWVTDGTESGTTMAVDLNGDNTGNVQYLTVYNDALYFSAMDTGGTWQELYRFDGTTAALVKDIYSGGGSSDPQNLMVWKGRLYFSVTTPDGNQIWSTDGTEAGTVLAGYIEPGASGEVDWLTPAGDYLVFVTSHSSYGYELFRLDGVSTQTELVKDIVAGTGDGSPNFLIPAGDLAFFEVNEDGFRGTYRTDGTPEGTYMVMAVDSHPLYGSFQGATAAGSQYYFTAYTAAAGFELFKSDGTPTGTVLVSDIVPGPGSSLALRPWNVLGTIFFAADDGVHGMELWQTDGTEAGTHMVADIFPGIGSANPFILLGGPALFFSAQNETSGYEIWLYRHEVPGTELMLPQIIKP